MTTTPEELFDENGYPSDEALEFLRNFEGSPKEYVGLVDSLWDDAYGDCRIEDCRDVINNPAKRLTLVTGGWSGCESVVGEVMDRTMFHLMFWESSFRGGRHTFVIPDSQWDSSVMAWGHIG
jgi:hypothetical protein